MCQILHGCLVGHPAPKDHIQFLTDHQNQVFGTGFHPECCCSNPAPRPAARLSPEPPLEMQAHQSPPNLACQQELRVTPMNTSM